MRRAILLALLVLPLAAWGPTGSAGVIVDDPDATAQLSWDAVAGASSYRVQPTSISTFGTRDADHYASIPLSNHDAPEWENYAAHLQWAIPDASREAPSTVRLHALVRLVSSCESLAVEPFVLRASVNDGDGYLPVTQVELPCASLPRDAFEWVVFDLDPRAFDEWPHPQIELEASDCRCVEIALDEGLVPSDHVLHIAGGGGLHRSHPFAVALEYRTERPPVEVANTALDLVGRAGERFEAIVEALASDGSVIATQPAAAEVPRLTPQRVSNVRFEGASRDVTLAWDAPPEAVRHPITYYVTEVRWHSLEFVYHPATTETNIHLGDVPTGNRIGYYIAAVGNARHEGWRSFFENRAAEPEPPHSAYAQRMEDGSVEVAWGSVEGASHYMVARLPSGVSTVRVGQNGTHSGYGNMKYLGILTGDRDLEVADDMPARTVAARVHSSAYAYDGFCARPWHGPLVHLNGHLAKHHDLRGSFDGDLAEADAIGIDRLRPGPNRIDFTLNFFEPVNHPDQLFLPYCPMYLGTRWVADDHDENPHLRNVDAWDLWLELDVVDAPLAWQRVDGTSLLDPNVEATDGARYAVAAVDARGYWTPTILTPRLFAHEAPAAPHALDVRPGRLGELKVSWEMTEAPLAPIVESVVRIGGVEVARTASNNATLSATPGATVEVSVTTSNLAGESVPATATATLPPSVPPAAAVDVTAEPGPGSRTVTLRWSPGHDSERPEAGLYQVWRDGELLLETPSTEAVDATAPGGEESAYVVTAVNAAGSATSAATYATAYVAGPPPAPVGLRAPSHEQHGHVLLSWSALPDTGVEPPLWFQVERRTVGGTGFTAVGAAPANATSYVDGPVNARHRYEYRISALNTDGYGAWSTMVDAAPFLLPLEDALADHAAATLGAEAIVLGGRGPDGATAQVAYIDLETRSTKVSSARLPVPLYDLGAVALDGEVWVMGGREADGTLHEAVYRYNATDDVLTRISTLPPAVAHLPVRPLVVPGTKMIAVAAGQAAAHYTPYSSWSVWAPKPWDLPVVDWKGTLSTATLGADAWFFDRASDIQRVSVGPEGIDGERYRDTPEHLRNGPIVTLDGRMAMFGGRHDGGPSDRIVVLEPEEQLVTGAPLRETLLEVRLPAPRSGHQAVLVDDELMLLGGRGCGAASAMCPWMDAVSLKPKGLIALASWIDGEKVLVRWHGPAAGSHLGLDKFRIEQRLQDGSILRLADATSNVRTAIVEPVNGELLVRLQVVAVPKLGAEAVAEAPPLPSPGVLE